MMEWKVIKGFLQLGLFLSSCYSLLWVILGALQSKDIIQEAINGFLLGALCCFVGWVIGFFINISKGR